MVLALLMELDFRTESESEEEDMVLDLIGKLGCQPDAQPES